MHTQKQNKKGTMRRPELKGHAHHKKIVIIIALSTRLCYKIGVIKAQQLYTEKWF